METLMSSVMVVHTCYANNDKRLGSEKRKDNRTKDGGQENLVDAIVGISVLEHIQRESKGWQNTI